MSTHSDWTLRLLTAAVVAMVCVPVLGRSLGVANGSRVMFRPPDLRRLTTPPIRARQHRLKNNRRLPLEQQKRYAAIGASSATTRNPPGNGVRIVEVANGRVGGERRPERRRQESNPITKINCT